MSTRSTTSPGSTTIGSGSEGTGGFAFLCDEVCEQQACRFPDPETCVPMCIAELVEAREIGHDCEIATFAFYECWYKQECDSFSPICPEAQEHVYKVCGTCLDGCGSTE